MSAWAFEELPKTGRLNSLSSRFGIKQQEQFNVADSNLTVIIYLPVVSHKDARIVKG
jgi:hypothetical protein